MKLEDLFKQKILIQNIIENRVKEINRKDTNIENIQFTAHSHYDELKITASDTTLKDKKREFVFRDLFYFGFDGIFDKTDLFFSLPTEIQNELIVEAEKFIIDVKINDDLVVNDIYNDTSNLELRKKFKNTNNRK